MTTERLIVRRNEGKKDIPTAFIFFFFFQEELKSGKLVNGQTGKNLDMMLSILNKNYPGIFPSCDRYDYRITNSSEYVHYKAFDNRTEPKKNEILEKDNLSRLIEDIREYKYIITFGKCALLAAESSANIFDMSDKRFIYSQHLSFLSLNSSIKTDINGKTIEKGSIDSTYRRLEVAAKNITDQIFGK